ncbi:MAG: family 1 encapsulin nanocompartment shell protein [Spirochaetales bacterium]
MDLRKRNLAPLSDSSWEYLEDNARDIISANVSARRVVDVKGPFGWDYSAVSLGRLEVPADAHGATVPKDGSSSEVGFGVRMVKPMVESRIAFALSRWELDNVTRGSVDADITPLEEAARKIAVFEERAVYEGLQLGSIEGLTTVGKHTATKGDGSYLGAIAKAVDTLKRSSIAGPYEVVFPTDRWQELLESSHGYPLEKHIRYITEGNVVASQNVENLYVISARGGDLELTLGQDFTIGYSHSDKDTVTLELFESFSFRVLEPRAYVTITL